MTIAAIRILGVDPGLRNTGWGLIEAAGSRLSFIACGSIRTDTATSLAERLASIHRSLSGLVARSLNREIVAGRRAAASSAPFSLIR